ncbi:MAG: hypothetical protein IJV83_01510 [Clostridia bacterium]|nr:hypothetical protein [Clostridia bacterium]
MKLFKKIASACLALTLCFGVFSLVACGNEDSISSSQPTSSETVSSEESSSAENSEAESSEESSVSEESSSTENSEAESSEASSSSENSEVDSSEEASVADSYKFIIQTAEGAPVAGYYIQLCVVDENLMPGVCYNPYMTASDAEGKVELPITNRVCPEEAVYEIHVMNESFAQVELAEKKYTPAQFSAEYIILTLAA